MPTLLEVIHTTTYRYKQAVRFGEHRLMFRPQARHDMRLLHAELQVTPQAEAARFVTDPFSNSIALVTPTTAASELKFVARFAIEHYGAENLDLPLAPAATTFPVDYSFEDRLDLHPFFITYAADPTGKLKAWAQRFVDNAGGNTRATLQAMMEEIRHQFTYRSRYEEGTQHPLDTVERCSGTCRDYAHLMIEACRQLGVAARFVSGYLYDPKLDGGEVGMTGAGSTHAWAEIYLPGAGWLAYDPTNLLYGGDALIRVATTRIPAQAIPLAGSFIGPSDAYLGMDVDVQVRKLAQLPDTNNPESLRQIASWLVDRLQIAATQTAPTSTNNS